LQLETGQLKGHFVVDREIVPFNHRIYSLAIEERYFSRIFRHFPRAAEMSSVEKETILGRRRSGSGFAAAAATAAASAVQR